MGNQDLLHPYYRNQYFLVQHIQKMPSFVEIECSLISCDIWFRTCNKDSPALIPSVQSKKRFSIQTCRFENNKRCIEKNLPWCHQECPADLVIITEDYKPNFQLKSLKGEKGVYFVRYEFGWRKSNISFAPITPAQYLQLKKIGVFFSRRSGGRC